MLGVAMYTTIKTLHGMGYNKSQISRVTKHDWKTVDKVIKSTSKPPNNKPHPRILDNYKQDILELLEEGLSGVRIHEQINTKGVKVSYSTVKDYISAIKKRNNIFVRIHTKPAEEAQVDFGYVGYRKDNKGKRRKTWIFNMKMSYSRKDFYKKVYNQRVETFIECHEEAFKYFTGVPEYVRIDNLKAAILEANFYEPVYQRLYDNFSRHYGFKIIPCRVRHPNDKGKVESGIKYVKGNFFAGRKFESGDELDRQLYNWQERVCNSRIHGTTRKVPNEVFINEEKAKLKSLPINKFAMPKSSKHKVYHDCHIYVKYNYYSVPFEYIGKEVETELSKDVLKVYYDNKLIAIHPKLKAEGEFNTIPGHYPKYKMYSDTENQEKYQIKMAEIGSYVEQMFFAMVENHPGFWSQAVKGVLCLVKKYPKDIINLACKRAIAFNVYKYQTIKNICENGSYTLPLEFDLSQEDEKYEYA